MKKKLIPTILLLMVVGFAAVSTSLFINGDTDISSTDDFYVYFSDALVNGVRDLSIVESEKELSFETTLSTLDEEFELSYDVTNSSQNYDADISITCTGDSEYLKVDNQFDTDTLLTARETRNGKLVLSLKKSNVGENIIVDVKCTLTATAGERTSLGEGDVADPMAPFVFNPGDVIEIGGETFYFMKEENKRMTLLAANSLGTNNRQTDSTELADYGIPFGPNLGWEWTPGPKEIELTKWAPTVKEYIDNYVSFIKTELSDTTVTGDLMTLAMLGEFGCTITADYSYAGGETCGNSEYASWLVNDQYWWTKSAGSEDIRVWCVLNKGYGGYLSDNDYRTNHGVRPIITISKSKYAVYLELNK